MHRYRDRGPNFIPVWLIVKCIYYLLLTTFTHLYAWTWTCDDYNIWLLTDNQLYMV